MKDIIIEITDNVFEELDIYIEGQKSIYRTLSENLPFNNFTLKFSMNCIETKENLIKQLKKEIRGKGEHITPKIRENINEIIKKSLQKPVFVDFEKTNNGDLIFHMYHQNETFVRFMYNSIISFVPIIKENNTFGDRMIIANKIGRIIANLIDYINLPTTTKTKEKFPVNINSKIKSASRNYKRSSNVNYIKKTVYKVIGNIITQNRTYERHTECWFNRGYKRVRCDKIEYIEGHFKGEKKDDPVAQRQAMIKHYKITDKNS